MCVGILEPLACCMNQIEVLSIELEKGTLVLLHLRAIEDTSSGAVVS